MPLSVPAGGKIKANAEKILLPSSFPKGILQLFSQFKSKNNWKKILGKKKECLPNCILIAISNCNFLLH